MAARAPAMELEPDQPTIGQVTSGCTSHHRRWTSVLITYPIRAALHRTQRPLTPVQPRDCSTSDNCQPTSHGF